MSIENLDDSEKSPTTITIYGVNYVLEGDIDPENVKALASYVDSKMWEISEEGGITSSTKLAVLTALNITEEYFKLASSRQKEIEFATRHINKMIKMLDTTMEEELFPEQEK